MILDKDQLKYITQAITPDQTTYVAQVSNILNSIPEEKCKEYSYCDSENKAAVVENPLQDDILFLNKIQAFMIRLRDIQWIISVENLKYKLDDLHWRTQEFLNIVMPIFRQAYQYEDQIFSNLILPKETDVLTIINDLKDTVFEFINKKYACNCDTAERQSIKAEAQNYLTQICKMLYEYRLAKCGTEYTKKIVTDENKEYAKAQLPVQTEVYDDSCETAMENVPYAYTPEYVHNY